ncbi:DEAD/DEAH box helicase (plasmid) [Deinococcus taeanensis]|uniref:DEAD/DEAH box helicase n=1 Tax=Deinococcus taeanensis TaxID=2737050 RepID=UPI001CDC5E4D|nr:DEAD/DEAH box helicase [Deinococcus taeanensis]UBV45514.1 DEAD/DEAH box helicase [Deinococcus taeanensis]
MLTAQQRQALAEVVKTNAYGSPFLSIAARSVYLHPSALRQELENDPTFEVFVKPAQGRNSECVRFRLSAGALLVQLPVARQHLQKAGYPQADLHALLQRLHEEKKLHEVDGQLRPGEGPAPDLRVYNPVRITATTEPVSLDGAANQPLTKDETIVLNGLENLEAPRINFGLYETFVTVEEIAAEAGVKQHLGDAAVPGLLKKLIEKRQVIEPLPGRYRSRISEIVRLLKNVKQRFKAGDEDSAPFLIQSLQVRFQDRRRLLRERSFTGALNTIRDGQRSRTVNAAAKLLTSGFSKALGRAPEDVALTNVQERALQALGSAYLSRAGGTFVVTGNTGSGKTEAALLPLLLGMLEEQVREGHKGVKALLVYPRQNLAKNQLERVCEYVAHLNRAMTEPGAQGLGVQPLSVGIVFGNTPETQAQLKGEQTDRYKRTWRPSDNGSFEVPYFSDADGAVVRARPRPNGQWAMTSGGGFAGGGWELQTFQPTREDILQSPPDILVITTEMLHRWLMDDRARNIFGLSRHYREAAAFHPPRALVMDEIHLYSGVHGAQIAALLRRFKRRVDNAMYAYAQHDASVQNPWRSPLLIGMSATIGRPQHFWHELTGVDEHRIQALTPQDEDYGEAQGRDYYLFIRPESFSRGKRIGDASAAIQTIMTISHNMVRRPAAEGTPAKFRSLIFQDSISKLKKLTVEFRDAESLKGLSSLRSAAPQGNSTFTSLAFMQGEYWYFDAADPFQYSEGRREPGRPVSTLSSGETPVYSGEGQSADILNRDIIFATTSLEVGYDDPSIQFVLQHHAPSNVASFVQKKGRAGRDLNDRPITAVTLSRNNYRDAFYYQNTSYLTDPADYEPALNAENDFVQRFHAVALLFDELVARTGRSWQRVPQGVTLDAHLNAVQGELQRLDSRGQFISQAYKWVVADSLQAQPEYATWEALWSWFTQTLLDPEVSSRAGEKPDLMRLCPAFPENLFSSVNLPLVQVMHPGRRGPESSWQFLKEDVALTFSELAPGRVTRRYGRHDLYWRPPYCV